MKGNALSFLYGLQRHGIRPGLARVEKLLGLLGNPESDFLSIHIAGTNGKGSTSAFAASILREAGFRTGLYTSPHLSKFNERIQVNGRAISDADLSRLVPRVRNAARGVKGQLSFFEFTTTLAFLYFSEKKTDVVVVETGMGGRWDATNTVAPLVSIITNVGLDHTAHLGSTLAEIAFEKAGIIKYGVPVVTGETHKAALSVIAKRARELDAPLIILGRAFDIDGDERSVDYTGIDGGIRGLKLGLSGAHQMSNASVALAALECVRMYGLHITAKAVRDGLKKASWPGRLEVVKKRPLVLLDAAHNPSGAKALGAYLEGLKKRRLSLVIGVMNDKDIKGIFKELMPLSDTVFLASPRVKRSAPVEALERLALPFKKRVISAGSVKEACRLAIAEAGPEDAVCVTGSIFTVGEARGYLIKSKK
ncbi:MAG: bifunctional folylpolyglutamate synthase/dihydrofolate synthase [Deltaproteobacteria bacterium]|nr:bifunctional folylpolyglutamate synthase/dihydrofolate synthase [Deltaproteobacteria bacterium]